MAMVRDREKNRQEQTKDKIQQIYSIAPLQTAQIVYNKGEHIVYIIFRHISMTRATYV